jgi:hypothetical protein
MPTEKVSKKQRGSLKSNSVNAKVTKFDTAVLRFVKRSNPSPAKLTAFIQDEWLKKTKSFLPASTAGKIAKRFAHLQASTHVKMGKTRKNRKQSGGALAFSPIGDAFGPGSLAPVMLKMPADITQSSQFAAASPVSYYTIAQDRGVPADGWAGYGPKPGMGDNKVGRRRSQRRQRQSQIGGAAFSLPGSVPMSTAELGINTSLGVTNPRFSTGNPTIPGFGLAYSEMKVPIDNSAQGITSQLPLVWKTTS